MSELTLVYSQMEDAAEYAKKAASKCQDYYDELNTKLSNQWSGLPSSPLSARNQRVDSAAYYVNQKKKKLQEKKTAYTKFANDVNYLIDEAKNADMQVAKTVNTSQKTFLDEHKNFSGDGWAGFFASLIVDVPVIGWLVESRVEIAEGFRDLCNNVRHWYQVGGGKKVVDTVLAIGEGILAIATLVAAIVTFPVSGVLATIVAVAGLIAGVIGLVDAGVNLVNQFKANSQSDPAWAQYYGGIDSASDALRKTTFKGGWKWLNKYSEGIATGLDIAMLICNIIDIADGIGQLYKRSGLKKLFSSPKTAADGTVKWKFDFEKFKQKIFTADGKASIKKSLKHSWKGMLFGDGGGTEGWKKRWKRAFTSKPTYGKDVKEITKVFDRIEKITKVFKTDFSKTMGIIKGGKRLGELFMFGKWDMKDSYDSIIDISSLIEKKGNIIKVLDDTVDTCKDAKDFISASGITKKVKKIKDLENLPKVSGGIGGGGGGRMGGR